MLANASTFLRHSAHWRLEGWPYSQTSIVRGIWSVIRNFAFLGRCVLTEEALRSCACICTPCSGISLLCSVAIGLAAWGTWKGKDIPEAAPKILAALGWSKVLKFWSFKCEIKPFPMRGHACKTFPFPMSTFHFVNCFIFRIKRLNRCLEGCWLACRILLWGRCCGFVDCCLFLCQGG